MRPSAALLCGVLLATAASVPQAAAQDLKAAAARERERREALKRAAGGPTSFLGTWNGVEEEGASRRYPTLTFFKDGGTIAYEVLGGTSALRLASVKLEGTTVRFSVAGPVGLRFYVGALSGDSISGKISADEPGRNPLGSFRLTRGAPAVMAVPADGPSSRLSFASSASDSPTRAKPESSGSVSARLPSSSSSSGPKTETELRREEGERRLESALANLSGQASTLAGLVKQYQSGCATAACDSLYRDIGRYAVSIGSGLERAEEEARQNSVLPGRVRELRAQYRLDHRFWDELSSLVARLEREHRAKKR